MNVLKYLFVAIIFLFSIINSFAQDEFKGGVQLGATASQIDNDRLGGYKKLGLKAGVFVARNFSPKNSGQVELNYTQKGAAEPTQYYKKHLDYVGVTVLFKRHFELFDLEAGLSSNFLANETNYYMKTKLPETEYTRLDFPISIGASYFLFDNMAVNARLSYSTVPIKIYWNNAISFSIFYYLR